MATTTSQNNDDLQQVWEVIKNFRTPIFIFLLIGLIGVVSSDSWFTVNDKQIAVVTTFGKYSGERQPGMHFKLPFGIQKVQKVDVNVYQKIELGYRTSNSSRENYKTIENESKMITGDYNIVNIDFFVEYKISNPREYLFNSYNPELILRNLSQSQIRNVIGSTGVDAVLTDGKSEIQVKVKEAIINELEKYKIGLILNDVKIQDSEPPTREVNIAFKEVENAKQNAEATRNQATAYKNSQLPIARANADKLLQQAQFFKADRTNEGTRTIAMFDAMYSQYVINPEITRTRMYLATISKVLPSVKLVMDLGDNGTMKILPLDKMISTEAK